jgi:hypothetical protein
MSAEKSHPEFSAFTRWLASNGRANAPFPAADSVRLEQLLAAARAARDHVLQTQELSRPPAIPSTRTRGHMEVLQLLAAADKSKTSRPPELTTARGFRVTLAYEEGGDAAEASICVLVRCPPELVAAVQGESAFLWSGAERFELGQFDSEGKAIGTLPAGIEISLSDFAQGKVKLEEPPQGSDE